MKTIVLKGRGDSAEWRDAARTLLLAGVQPRAVDWQIASPDGGAGGLFEPAQTPFEGLVSETVSARPAPSVPRAFLELAEAVLCHSDPARFDLLYRLLWRLQENRDLLGIRADADVAMADRMMKNIRRDSHKMKAFVRFKEVEKPEGETRRRFVAWFEPDHFIVARTAPFFQRRFNDMDWLILTPKGSAAWNGTDLQVRHEATEKPDITDQTDNLWRTYFTHIFNPARLKVRAMQSEMPKKYWKNLPEAELIPGLIASAEARVQAMLELQASQPPLRHERRRVEATPELQPIAGDLAALAREASTCTRCPLHCNATQTVFGEGPEDADIVFVGEQPGDREDLAGRPFAGPAGQVFNAALGKAGIDRQRVYVTNAVKHFKYEARGKRRLHKTPNRSEIDHCRWWLDQELKLIRPKVIVAMGATAIEGITQRRGAFSSLKGRTIALDEETSLVTTVHPAYLLRLPDEALRQAETEGFDQMMSEARKLIAS